MTFTKRLRDPIKRGEVTCTIRIWKRMQVKLGGRYAFDGGFVKVTKVRQIALADITPELARKSGFAGAVDLLKVARHGAGENVYLIDFRYEAA
ncbi:MAG: hypothetical protein WBQ17_07115 [Rhizomicrobium sp.]